MDAPSNSATPGQEAYVTLPTYSPVQELIAEHDTILAVLGAFEVWVDELALKGQQDRQGLRAFMRFFVEFADGCHHVKEERVLFAVMERFGFAQRPGPVESISGEHDESREIIRRLSVLASQAGEWTAAGVAQIRALVKSFLVLKRHHISKENRVLYPLVEARLPPQAWEEISQRFAAIEEERECSGQGVEIKELADELIGRFSSTAP